MVDVVSTVVGFIPAVISVANYIKDVMAAPEEQEQWRKDIEGIIKLENVLKNHRDEADKARNSAREQWYKNFKEAVGGTGSGNGSGTFQGFEKRVTELKKEVEWMHRHKHLSRFMHQNIRTEITQVFQKVQGLVSQLDSFLQHDIFAVSVDTNEKVTDTNVKVTRNTDQLDDLKRDFSAMRNTQMLQERRKKKEEITKWLSPLQFLQKHQEIYSKCFPTGQWLLESEEFTQWAKGSIWPLYCIGNPGAGKTVLASIIIHHVQERCKQLGSTRNVVLFLYLDRAESKIQTFENLFGSLLKQLVQSRPDDEALLQVLSQAYEDSKDETRLSSKDCLSILKSEIMKSYDRVFIIMDALDEFLPEGGRVTLRHTLQSIVPEKVSVLITSRELMDRHDNSSTDCNVCGAGKKGPGLRLYYTCKECKRNVCQKCKDQGKGCGVASHVQHAPERVVKDIITPDAEIEGFVKWDLGILLAQDQSLQDEESQFSSQLAPSRLAAFCEKDAQLRDRIPVRIAEQAKGMMLLAKLHLETLKRQQTPNRVKRSLDNLSNLDDISKVYEDILNHIKGYRTRGDRSLALRALSWVAEAQRPLTVLELQHALAVEDSEPSQSAIDKGDLVPWPIIQDITSSLLIKGASIEDVDRSSHQRVTVMFTHRTAHDFFSKKLNTPESAKERMADILKYLDFPLVAEPCRGTEEDVEVYARLQKLPFLAYACQFWGIHACKVASESESQEAALQLLRDPGRLASTMQIAWYVGSKSRVVASWDLRKGFSALHVCAWYALDFAVACLLNGDHELGIDSPDALDRTPLMIACKRGHVGTLKVLLKLHADPSTGCATGSSAIFEAILGNHIEVVEELLGNESVDVNKSYPKYHGRTVLMQAVIQKDEEVVRCLLRKDGIDVNMKDATGYSALCLGVTTDSLVIVDLLLNHKGIDTNARNGNEATALIIAAQYGNKDMVLSLLKHDADPSLVDCENGTAVFRALLNGHHSVVTAMLDSNFDINSKDDGGHSLLHAASRFARPDLVRLLITKGIDVDIQDDRGATPLHVASRSDNSDAMETITVLLDLGANPNVMDKNGRTPLKVAWQNGRTDAVKMLSKKSIDSILDDNSLPLWSLAKLGYGGSIRTRIENKTYDLSERDPDTRRTALHWAMESEGAAEVPEILTLLLDAGFSPSATDDDSYTPLHILAYRDLADLDVTTCLELFSKFHPPLEHLDRYGRTPLAAAQYTANKDTKDYSLAVDFLKSGASADGGIRDHLDATLFTAIRLGAVKVVEELVRVGANVEAREGDQTTFEAAKLCNRTEVLAVLRRPRRAEADETTDLGIEFR